MAKNIVVRSNPRMFELTANWEDFVGKTPDFIRSAFLDYYMKEETLLPPARLLDMFGEVIHNMLPVWNNEKRLVISRNNVKNRYWTSDRRVK